MHTARIPDYVELVDARPHVARGVVRYAPMGLIGWLALVTLLLVIL